MTHDLTYVIRIGDEVKLTEREKYNFKLYINTLQS